MIRRRTEWFILAFGGHSRLTHLEWSKGIIVRGSARGEWWGRDPDDEDTASGKRKSPCR